MRAGAGGGWARAWRARRARPAGPEHGLRGLRARSYWEERYTKDPEPFDWYQRYSGLKELINQYFKKADAILNVGAGNSRITEEMYEDGFHSLTNIDISKTVVDTMAEKHADKRGVTWQRMDMLEMDFPDGSFDAVFDKGTLDSVLCGENSTANAAKALTGVARVLKPGGVYFIVSYGIPENRLSYLENEAYGWSVRVHTVPKPTVSATAGADEAGEPSAVHYIYVCQKASA